MPMASDSLERGLSSEVRLRVSPGLMSLSRKPPPWVTRNGSANVIALLISSLVFISVLSSQLPAAAQRLVKLHDRQQLIAPCLGQAQLGVKQIAVGIERFKKVRHAAGIA